ncbi:hypothetical protein ONZ51_g8750 [Trametes cubensis]|uniref:MYND-type domain-containing protein n=1 Tax=Trametes cubensis TaxID=1111947 RepID=A0AAD7X8Z8_9APHY|nr:hypothetical protein ONZ51_g8750 [Trametes cubensis]
MDIMMASMQGGMASMRRALNRSKEEERIVQGKCSYCGKDGGGSLKGCSRCKAARYCNRECQLADFKARHKRECANFAYPPTTSAFLIRPVAGEQYPQHPVFAHAHQDGVGCWVSISGRIDCDLQHLTESIDPMGEGDRQKRFKEQGSAAGLEMIRKHKASARSLLGLSVLVQNRRKDSTPILLFASRAQVVCQPSLTAAVLRGAGEGEGLARFTRDRRVVERVAVGVANDPWEKQPRLEVKYINGAEVKKKAPLPSNIRDAAQGIIALNTGDYAILHLQFRVGNGDNISKDWEALGCLESFFIPWAPWDGTTPYASLAASLPTAQSAYLATPGDAPTSVRATFDQRAVRAHYADFIEHGEDAYLRSHYGDARADMAQSAEGMLATMGELLLGQVAQAGGTETLVQRLRDGGMGDIADKIAARGQ